MDLGLKDKVAVVAASSQGIGKAAALGFAAEGARITVLARDEDALRKTAEEIRGLHGTDVLAVPADVTRPEDVRRVVQQTLARFGAVHVLVNNAGGPPAGTFDDMDDRAWEAAFQLTLMSAVRMIREVRPHMRDAGGGAIVNVESVSVKTPLDNLILSNAIRSGVIGLVKSLSRELGRENIRVNTVLPGATRTARMERIIGIEAEKTGKSREAVQRAWEADIPLGRLGEPEDVASMIVFLASARARHVTGVTVQVDGGQVKSLL